MQHDYKTCMYLMRILPSALVSIRLFHHQLSRHQLQQTTMLATLPVLLAGCTLAAAAAVPAAGYCAKAPYNIILTLSTYAPAQSFCQARFPVVPATVTTTVTTTLPVVAARHPITQAPGAPVVERAVECKGNCSAWASLSKVGGSIVSSACRCIQTTPTVTTTVRRRPLFLQVVVTTARLTC